MERVAPDWPPERGMHVSGDVVLRVTLDRRGTLISAHAVSGHVLKRGIAVNAVQRWKFRPLIQRRKARRVTGFVRVNFPNNAQ